MNMENTTQRNLHPSSAVHMSHSTSRLSLRRLVASATVFTGASLVALSLFSPGATAAPTAQEKADQLQQEIKFAEEAKDADKKCGTKLETEIDWPSFEKGKWRESNYSLYSYCSNALEAFESLCIGPKSKAYVAKSVRRVRCSLVPEGKTSIVRKGKTLQFNMNPKARNLQQWARGATLKAL